MTEIEVAKGRWQFAVTIYRSGAVQRPLDHDTALPPYWTQCP
jgi:hypothetical protein